MSAPTLAFIGAGRMASAMIEGLLVRPSLPAAAIAVCSHSGASAQALARRHGLTWFASAAEAAATADQVVLAFKPAQLAAIAPGLVRAVTGKLVISVLAARPLAQLAAALPGARNLVRAMPNTPAAIQAGVTGWCAQHPLATTDRVAVLDLFAAMGRELEIPEERMDALMAISGCGPGFVFAIAAALRDAGVAAGLDRDQADFLVRETLLGSARLLARTGTEPEALRDQVASPQGTTHAGLMEMQQRDLPGLLRATVLAARDRAADLARQS